MAATATSASDVLKSLLNDAHSNTLLKPRSDVVRDKPVTLSSGKRIVLRAKSNKTKEKEKSAVSGMTADKNSLECVNMASLWEKIRIQEAAKRELHEFDKRREALEQSEKELRESMATGNSSSTKKRKNKGRVNSLWTEKYRPRKFIDLIGNERVNANILKWLSDWTYAVKSGKLIDSNSYDRDIYKDPLKRPRKKVLLIHGPPGIGKTTIAQCVCKQLGYEVQEVNSSDERSGTVVKEKVKNAMRMRSLSGKNVCLLLDEIDGAAGNEGGFIRVLVGLLNRDVRATEEWNSFNKLKWNKREDFLKRPIIAMCNDIGAHCLDQLKPYCEIVQFKKSSKKSIKKRLKMILEKEGVSGTSESLLDDLIISLDGDIRNCINFLQFSSRDLSGRLKDTEVVWFQLLKEIFNLERRPVQNDKSKSKSEVFQELMAKLSNTSNDLGRINAGCFNLMLQVDEDYGGSTLAKLDEVSDWLYFEDVMSRNYRLFEREELSLYGALTPLKFFSLFADVNDGRMSDRRDRFNFKSPERFETRRAVNELVGRLVREYRFAVSRDRLVSDELSMVNAIVVPSLLGVKELEHDEPRLRTIAGVLAQLKIEVECPTTGKGRFGGGGHGNSYMAGGRFKPDIVAGLVDSVCRDKDREAQAKGARDVDGDGDDDDKSLNAIRAMPYARAVGEYLARTQAAAGGTGAPPETGNSVDRNGAKRRPAPAGEDDGTGRKVPRREADASPGTTADYFKSQYRSFHAQLHRERPASADVDADADVDAGADAGAKAPMDAPQGVMHRNENRIWVKYHEGFSNAVRKEITLRGLLA